jgi:hypothetical protein
MTAAEMQRIVHIQAERSAGCHMSADVVEGHNGHALRRLRDQCRRPRREEVEYLLCGRWALAPLAPPGCTPKVCNLLHWLGS